MQDELSIKIQSVKGRGYRLAGGLELLDGGAIRGGLAQQLAGRLGPIDVLPRVDSTNRYLLAAASQGAVSGSIALAEQQTAGRGRLGRTWVSPFGRNVYCSLLWRFDMAAHALSGLSIVVAIALARALARYQDGIGIKWPNDILHNGRKLAGVLLEMQGEANGPVSVVIGFGVNVHMPDAAAQEIGQAWTDLYTAAGRRVSRNAVAAAILEQLVPAIEIFEAEGLAGFITEWAKWDILAGRQIELIMGDRIIPGRACGVDRTGALQLESEGIVKSYMAGEVSVKKQPQVVSQS